MNYYLNKLSSKIKSKKASILFIGQNSFSTKQAISISSKGFQVYFYNDASLKQIGELLDNNVHLTTLVYDVFDVDFIVFSKPADIKPNEIGEYFMQKTAWVNQFFHSGILVVVDKDLSKLPEISIKNVLETAAYDDPASPLIQSFKVNENYFYSELDLKVGKVIKTANEEVVSLVKEFLNLPVV